MYIPDMGLVHTGAFFLAEYLTIQEQDNASRVHLVLA